LDGVAPVVIEKEIGGMMQNLAKTWQPSQPVIHYGLVIEEIPGGFTVGTEAGVLTAEVAVSCVVTPMPGDTVLVSSDPAGPCYILSILKRDAQQSETQMRFAGPVNLHACGGLSLTADEDITLAARDDISGAASNITIHANSGSARIDRLSFIGRVFEGHIEQWRLVADTVEHIVRELTQRLENAFRFVKDHEEVQTGSARYLVEDTITTHSKNAVHMAEEIVKINAGQVHLG
jgi:hypothetical protein